jgi:hypothetical protein
VAKIGGNNGIAAYDPRQIWAANLAPLVTAAREGTAHAARTASKQRARARHEPAWWRQRWVIITAAGVAVAGAAGGVYATLASRRSRSSRHATPGTHPGLDEQPQPNGFKSTVDSGRSKVTGLARSMAHKLRGDEPSGLGAPRRQQPPSSLGQHPAEGEYHGQP